MLRKLAKNIVNNSSQVLALILLVQNLAIIGLVVWFLRTQKIDDWQVLWLGMRLLLLIMLLGSLAIGLVLKQIDKIQKMTVRLQKEISERREAEAQLKAAKESAEKANRTKSEFLANMSHELRTPLNAILGFSQLIATDKILLSRVSNELSIINRSGEHLLALINDILEISKIESGKVKLNPESFDLYELLEVLKEMFVNQATSKSLSLGFQLYKNVPQYIQTDLGKLRQVLINLLSNAIKFTEQGKVVLRVGVERNINRNKQKRVLIFDVADTGIGIAASEQSKLFDPFERTDSSSQQEGTGLGLAISQKFIQLMGGKIRVKSSLGKGSSFKFTILATIVSASDVKKVVKSELNQQVVSLAENQPHYRILVADDIDDNRMLIKTILSRVGFEVIEAVDGTEAIAQWQRYNPQLIFMDIQMPGMSGYEATRWIKSTVDGENTVIIALTASAFREKQQLVFEAGCDDFIAKPFQVDIIFDKIARYLGVEYLYENTRAMPEFSGPLSEGSVSSGSLSPLTASAFSGLNKEWLQQFRLAVTIGDISSIHNAIASIPSTHQDLAVVLNNLIEDFRLDLIQDLLSEL